MKNLNSRINDLRSEHGNRIAESARSLSWITSQVDSVGDLQHEYNNGYFTAIASDGKSFSVLIDGGEFFKDNRLVGKDQLLDAMAERFM